MSFYLEGLQLSTQAQISACVMFLKLPVAISMFMQAALYFFSSSEDFCVVASG
jgi:hypothetical protein